MGVRKLRDVARCVGGAFVGGTRDPRVPPGGAAQGHFGKRRVMGIAFARLAKHLVMPLPRQRAARRDHVAALPQGLTGRADVVPPGVEGFQVPLRRARQRRAGHRASVAVLVGHARRHKRRAAIAAVPEEPRAHDTARITGHVGPAVTIHVGA